MASVQESKTYSSDGNLERNTPMHDTTKENNSSSLLTLTICLIELVAIVGLSIALVVVSYDRLNSGSSSSNSAIPHNADMSLLNNIEQQKNWLGVKDYARPTEGLYSATNMIKFYHEAQYQQDVEMLTSKWADMYFQNKGTPDQVVFFDIDETLLSSYAGSEKTGFGFNQKDWNKNAGIAKNAGIQAVIDLYKKVKELGYRPIILTGRQVSATLTVDNQTVSLREATLRNLRYAGLDIPAAEEKYVLLRPTTFDSHGNRNNEATYFKYAIRKFIIDGPRDGQNRTLDQGDGISYDYTKDGFSRVYACVGDQISDCSAPAMGPDGQQTAGPGGNIGNNPSWMFKENQVPMMEKYTGHVLKLPNTFYFVK
eukprot:Nk52_evm4s2192 gene=Nk52_evmTU4s2192